MVRDTVAKGGTVLFVGTKRQAQATIEQEALRAGMPYINQRWLGGTLTNWVTIRQRIQYLLPAGTAHGCRRVPQPAQERAPVDPARGGKAEPPYRWSEDHAQRLPDMIFVVDTNVEALAVDEANKLKIPIIGMVDTNSNPDQITYVIPSNDDAIRAVKLVVGAIADAAEEGMRIREVEMAETGQVSRRELAEMEQYLGPSVLAKLQTIDDRRRSRLAEEYAGDEVEAVVEDVSRGESKNLDERV